MQPQGFLALTSALAVTFVAFLLALDNSGRTVAQGPIADQGAVLRGDTLEQTTGIIYPYSRSPEGSSGDFFAAPDVALLRAADELACPGRHAWRAMEGLSIEACVPDTWEVETHATEHGQPAYSLGREPALTGEVPVEGLVVASIAFVPGLTVSCTETGHLYTPAGEIDVCFHAPADVDDSGVSAAYTSLIFALQLDAESPITGSLLAIRMLGNQPLTLDDEAFRDAMAILANLRPVTSNQ